MTNPISFQDVCQAFEAHRAQLEEGASTPDESPVSLPELYKTLSAYVIEQGKVNAEQLASLQTLSKKYIRSQELKMELEQASCPPSEWDKRDFEETITIIKSFAEQPYALSTITWNFSILSSDEFRRLENRMDCSFEELQRHLPLFNAARKAQEVFKGLRKAAYEKDQPAFEEKLTELLPIYSEGLKIEHRIFDALIKELESNLQDAKNQKLAAG